MDQTCDMFVWGRKGQNSSVMNGNFIRGESLHNAHPFFKATFNDDVFIYYNAAQKDWRFSKKADLDTTTCYAYAPGEDVKSPDLVKNWKVWDGKAFTHDPQTHVDFVRPHSFMIKGRKGYNSSEVNGIFVQQDDFVNGKPMYVRRDNDDTVAWYRKDSNDWRIGQRKNIGTSTCYAYTEGGYSHFLTCGGLRIWDSKAFTWDRTLKIQSLCPPLAFTSGGRQGYNSSEVNAQWLIKCLHNGHPLYERIDNAQRVLYWNKEKKHWKVSSRAEMDTDTCYAYTLEEHGFPGTLSGKMKVWDSKLWNVDEQLQFSETLCQTLHVSGRVGGNSQINGDYTLQADQFNGKPWWMKPNDKNYCIFYHKNEKDWRIGKHHERNTTTAFAYTKLSDLSFPWAKGSSEGVCWWLWNPGQKKWLPDHKIKIGGSRPKKEGLVLRKNADDDKAMKNYVQGAQRKKELLAKLKAAPAQKMIITGRVGGNSQINGEYHYQGTFNGKPWWKKPNDDNYCIFYQAKEKDWRIGKLHERETTTCFCYNKENTELPHDPNRRNPWWCWSPKHKKWMPDPEIHVGPPIGDYEVCGRKGYNSAICGVYQYMGNFNKKPWWQKPNDENYCIYWHGSSHDWRCGKKHERTTLTCFAYRKNGDRLGRPDNPWADDQGNYGLVPWEIWDGNKDSWVADPEIFVLPVGTERKVSEQALKEEVKKEVKKEADLSPEEKVKKQLDEHNCGKIYKHFVDNDLLDMEEWPELTQEDLKELKIPLGTRKRFLNIDWAGVLSGKEAKMKEEQAALDLSQPVHKGFPPFKLNAFCCFDTKTGTNWWMQDQHWQKQYTGHRECYTHANGKPPDEDSYKRWFGWAWMDQQPLFFSCTLNNPKGYPGNRGVDKEAKVDSTDVMSSDNFKQLSRGLYKCTDERLAKLVVDKQSKAYKLMEIMWT